MNISLSHKVCERAAQLSTITGLDYNVFDHDTGHFLGSNLPSFCQSCEYSLVNKCNPHFTHKYGSFEAERWNGLYIYYCPIGLVFINTITYIENSPVLALVAGPIVMGTVADVLTDNGGKMIEDILSLNAMPANKVTDISQIQWSISMFLSGRNANEMDYTSKEKSRLLNTLYDVTLEMQKEPDYSYPFELERRLQDMIIRGDKEGSRELINELLGHIYFQSDGDFDFIKEQARALIVLFSRASIEGGADVKQIFGLNRDILTDIADFETLDELSAFLTTIFHRFVSYVFDFNQVQHVDIIHKVIGYIRQHYMTKISLDDVAKHVYLSKSYLSKIFKDEMKCSFTNYVNSVRIEKSKELLLENSLSLVDIAALVGFNDQSYFSKVFLNITGVTPQHYRKKRGKIPERK